jgi:phosphoglycerol transferase
LGQENINFSGDSTNLNGGVVYSGTSWTMGGIFAQSTGLPLQTTAFNSMSTQNSFYSGITGLGNILEDQGYRQIFLCGSDVTFGGRKAYFTDHGNFEFRDLTWARETGHVAPDYQVWWGYEDQKLFEYAKETLTELAASDQPFILTMLTVDTHFEDGYVCPLCGTEFGDNQYANVIACSSRQVASFVRWIQQQDFYQNTTIVLSGDHTTMYSDFCDDVPSEYLRKTYVCFINPDAEVKSPDKTRLYGTIDMFPTTLAALGVQIDGNRLGLVLASGDFDRLESVDFSQF